MTHPNHATVRTMLVSAMQEATTHGRFHFRDDPAGFPSAAIVGGHSTDEQWPPVMDADMLAAIVADWFGGRQP